jgi:hypothetical protein
MHVMIIALAALLAFGLANGPRHGAPPVPVGMDTQQAGGPS